MSETDPIPSPSATRPPRAARGPSRRRRRLRRLPLGGWVSVSLLVLLAAFFAVLELSRPHVSGDRLRVDTLQRALDDGRIRTGRILDADGLLVGEYRRPDGTIATYNAPYFRSDPGARQALARLLLAAQVPTTIDQQVAKALVFPALLFLLPSLMFVLVIVYLRVSSARGTGLFGIRSGARRIQAQEIATSFHDVAGQDDAVAALRELAEFLATPDRYAAVGVTIPKGVLLFGPPGCGKTLMARALAGESGAAFFSISGSDFVELYVGVGASRVRELFREARDQAPSLVFIDEIDSFAQRRSAGAGDTGSSSEQEQALNQLLAEMDGFATNAGVIVIGATNRPDTLDPALLRPGRFDRSIGLELPDLHGRRTILGVHVRGKPLAPGVDLAQVASGAVGMTGADLASVVNEAGLLAARAGRTQIAQPDFEQAVQRILEAPERQRRLSLRARSVGQRTLAEDRVTFADVAGADDAIEELREIREYLGAPDRFVEMGARIPHGYLLSGPPGCGKTLLARAVAGESNAAFVSVAGTEFVQRYAGEGAARVRDLFAEARSIAPAIVFIDEIDAVGTSRGSGSDDGGERHQTLNQILVELDGFSQRAGIVVIAATNRPDTLDPALVRPGRFDRHVLVDLPALHARREILALHAAGKPLAAGADLEAVARLTQGMGGADLANVMNEAALLAARRGVAAITMAILDEAIERASLGIGAANAMTDADRRLVAYHEAGHGLVAMALPGGKVLHRITIIPRARALGAAWVLESGDRVTRTHSLLLERMAMMLGGRAAERVVLGELGDVAGADLVAVTEIAHRMVGELGMSDALGALSYGDGHGARRPSDDTARLIDHEVRRLVEEAEAMAIGVLTRQRAALDRVAEALLERETLTLAEVAQIAGTPTFARADQTW